LAFVIEAIEPADWIDTLPQGEMGSTKVRKPEASQMSLSSYSDVFAIRHERDYAEDIRAGDIVRSGPNHFPHFEVIAVSGDKAWVRDVQTGADHLAFLSRCRKLFQPMLMAAE